MSHPLATPAPPLSREEVLQVAERCCTLLKTRFGARRVIVFGSAAGQAPWHAGSDLDLAVEGIRPEEFFRAHSALEDLAPRGLKVDLVDLASAYPEMCARILGEVEVSDDPILDLRGLIEDELTALERIASQTREILDEAHYPPTWIELRAMGSLVHDFYSGVESIFRRIATRIDGGVPRTANWHRDLLDQMNEPRAGKRPPVISDQLWTWLGDDLDFRHFFRNAYAATLEWDKLRFHLDRMADTLALLRTELEQFFIARGSQKDSRD